MTTRAGFWVVAIVSILFATGCASAVKPPTMMAPGFEAKIIDKLVLLPVADHRVDKATTLELDTWVLPIAERQLESKNYSFVVEHDRSLVDRVTSAMLDAPPGEWVGSLGPGGSRWVMLLVLEDSSSSLTFGSTGNAEMSGYLFDKHTPALVWRNKELSRVGQGGLLGMAMKGYMEQGAIEMATIETFRALPFHHEK